MVAEQPEAVVAATNKSIKAPKKKLSSNNAISKLTASAMAIPSISISSLGISPIAHGAVAPEEHEVSLRLTQYREEDMPLERVTVGSEQRYNIDILQFSLATPLNNQKRLETYLAYETMSGASPLKSQQNTSEQTEVLMSGASIEEKRLDANITLTQFSKRSTVSGGVAISDENDYQSIALSLDGSIENNNKHLTLIGSLSISSDELSPTDPDSNPIRTAAVGETKNSASIYVGFNRILSQYSTFQMGLGYTQLSGYLSDPYRITDLRPEERGQSTLDMQYRTFSTSIAAAVHFNYRYYEDDWELLAHTIESSIWKELNFSGFKITLIPNVRYYWQHQAYFYDLDSTSTAEFQSSDFRLSAYGSFGAGLDIKFKISDTSLTLGISQYVSGETLGLSGKQDYETPSLVNFSTLSLGLDQKF